MAKVFISYSRKDIEFAKILTGELKKNELDFWVDWEGIPPTVDWWRQIEKGIEETDAFLFLISPDSAASKVCGQEIDYAVKNSKRIIPLIVRDTKGDESPAQLNHLNWIFFREQDDFNASLQKLLTAIHTDYDWVQNHRRLQVKALEWERNNHESGFLLRGKDLLDAETNLAVNTSKEPHPTDLQREYVLQSRKATDRQRRLVTSVSIVGVIALAALAVYGFMQARSAQAAQIAAEKETRRATAGKLALESKTALESYPQRALLLALEAVRTNQAKGESVSPEAEEALRFAVERVPGIRLDGFDNYVSFVHFTKGKNTWLVAAGEQETAQTVRIWNVEKLTEDSTYKPFNVSLPKMPDDSSWIEFGTKKIDVATSLESETRTDLLIAVSPQDTWLVTMAEKGYDLWLIADEDETRTPIHFDTTPIFIDQSDDTLVMEQQDTQIILWRVNSRSMQKREVKRIEGEYVPDVSNAKWFVTRAAQGDSLWLFADKDATRAAINFEGQIFLFVIQGEAHVIEQRAAQVILWTVDSVAYQKQEVKRFEGEYVMTSPENKYIVVKDLQNNLLIWDALNKAEPKALNVQADVEKSPITFDPHDRWFIVFQDTLRPEILVPELDEYRTPTGKQIPWNSTTMLVFPLSNLGAQPFRFALDQHLYVADYSRLTNWKFTPNGKTMVVELRTRPDTNGVSQNTMGVLYLQGETPFIQISTSGQIDWRIINDRWIYDFNNGLNSGAFIDLQDSDLKADANYSVPPDDRYFMPYYDGGTEPTFTENGKYLVGGGGRERINLEILNNTHELVLETNPDASTSQTDIAKLLKYNPKTIGVEDEVTFSVTSADGKWIAAGTADGSLRLWDYKTPFASSLQRSEDPRYMALSNDAQWLATGDSLWKLKDGKPAVEHQMEFSGGKFTYAVGVFSPDSRWFIHLGMFGDQTDNGKLPAIDVSLLDMTQKMSKTVEPTIISQPGKIYSVAQFSPNSKWVVVGGDAGALSEITSVDAFIFNLENKTSYSLPYEFDDAIFTTDQKHIILVLSGKAEIWALPGSPSGALKKTSALDGQGRITISRDGRWLMEVPIVSTADGFDTTSLKTESRLWDVNCIVEGYECKPFTLLTNKVNFSPDSQYLILGWQTAEDYGSSNDYEIWDLQSANDKPIKVYAANSLRTELTTGSAGNLMTVQAHESCDYSGRPASIAVLASSWEKNPSLANLSTFDGYAYLTLSGGGGGGGGDSGYHKDYRVDTLLRDGEDYLPITLRGHETSIMATQISPNERYVLTYSSGTGMDCTTREHLLRLWDMDKMKEDPQTKPVILPLKNDGKTSISHLAFSPNSEWVYVIDDTHTLYYFPTSVKTLQQKACLEVGRNFIINEWERFFPYDAYRKTCENLTVHPSAK